MRMAILRMQEWPTIVIDDTGILSYCRVATILLDVLSSKLVFTNLL